MATAFAEPFVLLPLFLKDLTSSNLLVGLVLSLLQSGRALPQLWASRVLRRHPHRGRRMMLTAVWTRWVIWAALTATVCGIASAPWTLAVIVPVLALYAVAGGVANIPINQVIAATIPPGKRSSFFGLRLLFGGLLAMVAGYGVKTVLAVPTLTWPANYGALFLLSLLALGGAYTFLSFVRFPSHAVVHPPGGQVPALRDELRAVLRAYPILWRLVGVQWLAGGLAVALPFLTLYGREVLGFPTAWVGTLIMAQTLGAVLGNLVWMPLGNRKGTRVVALCAMRGALLGMLYIGVVESPVAFAAGFALLGFSTSGIVVGFDGYILELGTEKNRPLIVGIQETLLLPVYFFPVLGGLLVELFGYRSLVIAATAFLAPAVILGRGLCEPRSADPDCGPVRSPCDET
jgi:MFS family permease